MITEHNQILASVKWKSQGITKKKQITKEDTNKFTDFPRKNSDGTPNPHGIGFQYHPCTVWAGESIDNYIWLCNLTLEMCKEYTKRYGKIHAGEEIVKWHKYNSPPLAIIGIKMILLNGYTQKHHYGLKKLKLKKKQQIVC